MEEGDSSMKKKLRDLCFSNGSSYAVLWHFDPRNHMLLTMEDAYFEEHVRSVVDNMRLQVHILGEGNIGEAALDGKHRWISVDSPTEGQNAAWNDSDLGLQFSSGIKTVVVMPLEFRGVVEFGFTKEISEKLEFLDQARKSLLENYHSVGVSLAGSTSSSLNFNTDDQNGLLASVISSHNSYHSNGNGSTSWSIGAENMGSSWMLDSLVFSGSHFDGTCRDQSLDGDVVIDPNFNSLVRDNVRLSNSLNELEEQVAHCSPSLFDAYPIDDFSPWPSDPANLSVLLDPLVADDILPAPKVECMSSAIGGTDIFSGIQSDKLAGISYSSLHNALNSCGEGKSLTVPAKNDELLNNQFRVDTDCGNWGECLKDVIYPVGGIVHYPLPIDTCMSISECVSGGEASSVVAPRKGLFSELGLEHLLRDGASTTRSCIDDPWTVAKKKRIEPVHTNNDQTRFGTSSWDVKASKEYISKSQAELWINDSHSMDVKSCISSVSAGRTRPEEQPKPTKKRARPGESTRPRPKDRQMIADRIKELRDMIPNGAKLSIDALLSHTVKHMLFLQNLTKHADKLKKLGASKLIGRSMLRKDNKKSMCSNGSRGATWAYEVGDQNLFCPIIVEDLNHPGEMLIEMLCEERGYFLEIADVVRGLGLTILKGVMESRDDKVWAHYIVEGNKHVTRMDVFVSLMELLQGSTSQVEVNRSIKPTGMIHNGVSSWSHYQHQQLVQHVA